MPALIQVLLRVLSSRFACSVRRVRPSALRTLVSTFGPFVSGSALSHTVRSAVPSPSAIVRSGRSVRSRPPLSVLFCDGSAGLAPQGGFRRSRRLPVPGPLCCHPVPVVPLFPCLRSDGCAFLQLAAPPLLQLGLASACPGHVPAQPQAGQPLRPLRLSANLKSPSDTQVPHLRPRYAPPPGPSTASTLCTFRTSRPFLATPTLTR